MRTRLFLFVFILIISCKKLWEDDAFSLQKTIYNGKELRTDGYFIKSSNSNLKEILIFYKNGVVLNGTIEESRLNIDLQNGAFYNIIKNRKRSWGLFSIDNEHLEFELYYPSSGGGLPLYLNKASIIDKEHFKVFEAIRRKNGETEVLNELYTFKFLATKPDSTNTYIP